MSNGCHRVSTFSEVLGGVTQVVILRCKAIFGSTLGFLRSKFWECEGWLSRGCHLLRSIGRRDASGNL